MRNCAKKQRVALGVGNPAATVLRRNRATVAQHTSRYTFPWTVAIFIFVLLGGEDGESRYDLLWHERFVVAISPRYPYNTRVRRQRPWRRTSYCHIIWFLKLRCRKTRRDCDATPLLSTRGISISRLRRYRYGARVFHAAACRSTPLDRVH